MITAHIRAVIGAIPDFSPIGLKAVENRSFRARLQLFRLKIQLAVKLQLK